MVFRSSRQNLSLGEDFMKINTRGYGLYGQALGKQTVKLLWRVAAKKDVLVGDVAQRVETVLREVVQEKDWLILHLEVAPQYVYLTIDLPPTVGIAQAVRAFRTKSAKCLKEEFPQFSKAPSVWTFDYLFTTEEELPKGTIDEFVGVTQREVCCE
jgi:putative transposase